MKLVPLGVLTFVLGWWSAQPVSAPVHDGFYMVAEEQQYGKGIQFFALQRVDATEIDRAVCSLDGDLPLAKTLSELHGKRVRLVIEDASRELYRLGR